MTTVFDVMTTTCFVALVIAFFKFTERDTRTLVEFVLIGVILAVANQVGNAGSALFAALLILAGIAYGVVVVRR